MSVVHYATFMENIVEYSVTKLTIRCSSLHQIKQCITKNIIIKLPYTLTCVHRRMTRLWDTLGLSGQALIRDMSILALGDIATRCCIGEIIGKTTLVTSLSTC